MTELYKPKMEDLWFREQMMADEDTMSYNHAWGGTIPFPRNCWEEWYDWWIVNHENRRFYRYLRNTETGEFVGETAYHYDEGRQIWCADVIVFAPYRRRGYGNDGLRLLMQEAKINGIRILYDDIAIDNPAVSLFLNNGFQEEYRTSEIIMLKKEL